MTISSMTGYARSAGAQDGLAWQWDVKSVNGKALDVRCRLPAGYEGLEGGVRTAAQKALRRGNLQVSLSISGTATPETVRLNEEVLNQLVDAGEALRDRIGGEPLRADTLLSIRGVLEVVPEAEDEAAVEARQAAILASFEEAAASLVAARRDEGAKLKALVSGQIGRIKERVDSARAHPSRSVEAIRQRLAEQVARLLDTGAAFDADRLHQEAVLLATRSDIQEELDRLDAHVEAAQALLNSPDAVGRKFDFLAQEFNREANTLCSKSADRSLTAIGLDLKTVIDQMREQVQNIE